MEYQLVSVRYDKVFWEEWIVPRLEAFHRCWHDPESDMNDVPDAPFHPNDSAYIVSQLVKVAEVKDACGRGIPSRGSVRDEWRWVCEIAQEDPNWLARERQIVMAW
jgi:hypothetical protein